MSALGQKRTSIISFEAKKETALVAVSPKSGQALCSGGGGLSVGLQEGQQVGIYRICLGGRHAVREALVGL
jgi:hypothetical protein